MANLKNLGMIGAGAAGAVALTFGAAGIAGAQEDDPVLTDPATADADDSAEEGLGHGNRGEHREAMIDRLVEEGVITQEQAEDVAAVRDAVQAHREEIRAEKQQSIADALEVTVEELEAAREEGTTLAELAGDDLSEIVDLFTTQATERIEEGVANGRITQEQADERLDGLAERIESRLEDGGGFGRRGDGHRGRHGHGLRGGDAHVAEGQETSLT